MGNLAGEISEISERSHSDPLSPEQQAALHRQAQAFVEMADRVATLRAYNRDDLVTIILGNANTFRSILHPPDQGSDG